jgi:hypothetical protein
MENALTLALILLFAELFEASMQRAQTLLGVLGKLYVYYAKHIFLFFLLQPSFYVLIGIIMFTGVLNLPMVFILALKIFDMFFKIELIKKVFIERQVSQEIAQMLTGNIPPYFFLIGAGLYPFVLFYALA